MFRLRCEEKGLELRVENRMQNAEVGSEARVCVESRVRGDESKLRQVLVNLLGNAVKFTEKGCITLRVACVGHDRFRFEVTDTGPGMAPETRGELFQPFQQSELGVQQGGTGLGLALSQRQVTLMGGNLTVDSVAGQETRVYFEIDLKPVSASEEPQVGSAMSSRRVARLAFGSEVRALVVDDVAQNLDVLSRLLSGIGCRVQVATSGHEALAQLRNGLPDIVFLDIRMPGMDGLETTGRILQEFGAGRMKLVAISASALAHERRNYLDQGFDAFLGKPFQFEKVCETLADLLGVRFEYEEGDSGAPMGKLREVDLAGIELPQDIVTRLADAANRYSITRLNRCVAELEKTEPRGAQVAAHLRTLIKANDMDGIAGFLDKVTELQGRSDGPTADESLGSQ